MFIGRKSELETLTKAIKMVIPQSFYMDDVDSEKQA